jgi:hypothetical protein
MERIEGRRYSAEDRKQRTGKTENAVQRTGNRVCNAEDRRQRMKCRGLETEVAIQRTIEDAVQRTAYIGYVL